MFTDAIPTCCEMINHFLMRSLAAAFECIKFDAPSSAAQSFVSVHDHVSSKSVHGTCWMWEISWQCCLTFGCIFTLKLALMHFWGRSSLPWNLTMQNHSRRLSRPLSTRQANSRSPQEPFTTVGRAITTRGVQVGLNSLNHFISVECSVREMSASAAVQFAARRPEMLQRPINNTNVHTLVIQKWY